MTPYGIVYNENIHAFEESVKVWQKKFGVLNAKTFLKISAVLWALAVVVTVVLYLAEIDATYAVFYAVLTLFVNIFSYFTAKNGYIKQICHGNFQPVQKQIVLFDDRMEITTGFTKGTYYYDEIVFVHEKNGIITIIIDKGAVPYCVCAHSIIKGDYRIFASVLKEKNAPVYKQEGGAA